MLKIYAVVVLGTVVSFFADVAPFGGCCGGNRPTPGEKPPGEPPTDARRALPVKSRLASRVQLRIPADSYASTLERLPSQRP